MTVSNTDDVIDSRDVIKRLEELRDEERDLIDATEDEDYQPSAVDELAEWREENGEELAALEALAKEGEAYASDWLHGEALIRDSYFTEYAQQLADDIGAINRDMAWPLCHIDWEAAADALKMDYTSIDFDGVEYWVRS